MSAEEKPWGCLLRVFWMMAGYIILLLISVKIISSRDSLSGFDLAFCLTAILVVVARFVDIRFFDLGFVVDDVLSTRQASKCV